MAKATIINLETDDIEIKTVAKPGELNAMSVPTGVIASLLSVSGAAAMIMDVQYHQPLDELLMVKDFIYYEGSAFVTFIDGRGDLRVTTMCGPGGWLSQSESR